MVSQTVKMFATLTVLVGLATTFVWGVITTTEIIQNQATLATIDIDVYWDVTCTQKCMAIDWGTLEPGGNKTVGIYVKNTGGAPITGSFNVSNWVPAHAAQYMTLNWTFGETVLLPGRVRATDFTLTVDRSIEDVTNFYFTITVVGKSIY